MASVFLPQQAFAFGAGAGAGAAVCANAVTGKHSLVALLSAFCLHTTQYQCGISGVLVTHVKLQIKLYPRYHIARFS